MVVISSHILFGNGIIAYNNRNYYSFYQILLEEILIKLAFKINSFFWILSPLLFVIGHFFFRINFKGINFLVFAGLMVMSGISTFLNYEGEE